MPHSLFESHLNAVFYGLYLLLCWWPLTLICVFFLSPPEGLGERSCSTHLIGWMTAGTAWWSVNPLWTVYVHSTVNMLYVKCIYTNILTYFSNSTGHVLCVRITVISVLSLETLRLFSLSKVCCFHYLAVALLMGSVLDDGYVLDVHPPLHPHTHRHTPTGMHRVASHITPA